MKSFNLSVEFNGPPTIQQPHRTCMICFFLPDEVNEADVYDLFHEVLVSVILYAKTTNTKTSAALAVCKAAKAIKDRFGGESFMFAANSSLVIELC